MVTGPAPRAVLHYWLFMSKIPPATLRGTKRKRERTTPGRRANARSGSLLAYPRDTEVWGVSGDGWSVDEDGISVDKREEGR